MNFGPGNTDETIAIATKDDSIIEADEVFAVYLSTTNSNVQIDKIKGVIIITINDNDGKCIENALFKIAPTMLKMVFYLL